MDHDGPEADCQGECLQLSEEDTAWWASVFKTLGDPVRLQLLVRLAALKGAEVPVHELCNVQVSASTVSHHLKRLRCMGLIESRRDGRVIYYRLGHGVRAALLQILHQKEQAEAP
ncbi:ArsR/SmtB family transcription factor [Streptomyces antibioticus]|uniref:ArsR/SmtB family transcription factor n=1 Tax=Streptomyces antibioticus TaxID=1890 RepID=UPI0036F6CF56